VTGAPTVGTIGVGIALVAAGGFALWSTRRRREA
jgi:LPXTG-motif cell wall-anchored protein